MVTVRCMRILGDESEIFLALENSKSEKRARACEYVCARARAILGTHRLVNFRDGR